MITLMIQRKAVDKIQQPFIILKTKQTSQQIKNKGEPPQVDKELLQKPTINIIHNGEKLNAFPLKSKTKQ